MTYQLGETSDAHKKNMFAPKESTRMLYRVETGPNTNKQQPPIFLGTWECQGDYTMAVLLKHALDKHPQVEFSAYRVPDSAENWFLLTCRSTIDPRKALYESIQREQTTIASLHTQVSQEKQRLAACVNIKPL